MCFTLPKEYVSHDNVAAKFWTCISNDIFFQVEAQDGEVAAPGNRPMTFEEKRRLSQGLGSLPGDKLGLVMEIIAESQNLGEVHPLPLLCLQTSSSALVRLVL